MGVPAPSDVIAAASQWGTNQLFMFAYARRNGTLPTGVADVQNFQTKVTAHAQALASGREDLVEGYVQATGTWPATAAYLTAYAQQNNWIDGAGNEINSPLPGQGYPGAGASTATGVGGTTQSAPAAPAAPASPLAGIMSFVQSNPLVVGGGALAVVVLLAMSGGGHRR